MPVNYDEVKIVYFFNKIKSPGKIMAIVIVILIYEIKGISSTGPYPQDNRYLDSRDPPASFPAALSLSRLCFGKDPSMGPQKYQDGTKFLLCPPHSRSRWSFPTRLITNYQHHNNANLNKSCFAQDEAVFLHR